MVVVAMLALFLAATAAPARVTAQAQPTIIVSSTTSAGRTPIADAIRRSAPGGRVIVRAGSYREPTIVIDRPGLTLEGEPGGGSGAVLDGEGARTILVIAADDVTVRGLTFRNTGPSQSEERAGIRADSARNCRIEGNRLERTLFAIYLSRSNGCAIIRNVVRGAGTAQMVSGNGVHVWSSDSVLVAFNEISGHRDGIYFEFVRGGEVHDNRTDASARYGLHFMFSDDCRYERNVFESNGNGIAVMYSKRVLMHENRFSRHWGGAAYGLLLKDISDSRITGNHFDANSVGLHLEDSNRNTVSGNTFSQNGWALRLMANAQDNVFEANIFERNTFDVATNSRSNYSRFTGNYWDRYRGWDLDRDGRGDVPHPPVRLFALVVEQSPPTIILLRSLLVDLLDTVERLLPTLTPAALVDERPLMRRPARESIDD